MTICRYDRETGAYVLPDGEPCKVDEYGDPTRHCTARKTCSQHIGWGELTCARCIGRVRQDIRQIVERASLMLEEAMEVGNLGEAAWMAAPAADPRGWAEQRLAAIGHLDHWLKAGRIKERQYDHARGTIDDDEHHPYNVTTRWHLMLAEGYKLPLPDKMTTTDSAAFLDRILHRVAQDDGQDFPLLARELRKCRAHLESVLRDSLAPERGAPCPDCRANDAARLERDPAYKGKLVRLVRWYAHWCNDPECEQQFHPVTDELDRWVCPRDKAHSWDVESYSKYVEERMGA